MIDKAATDGLTPTEFARRDGCSATLVRRRARAGYLPTLPNGRISPAYVGTAWRASAAPGAKPVSSVKASDGAPNTDGPPPWLRPVHDCDDPLAKGVLLGVLAMFSAIEALTAAAALEAGSEIPVAKLAGRLTAIAFAGHAADFMRANRIEPFEHDDDPRIWRPDDVSLSVDWRKIAEDTGVPYEPKKWAAYAAARKAEISRECEAEAAEARRAKKAGVRKASHSAK